MARKTFKQTTTTGAVYDHNTKTYVATRKDGTVTIGRFNEKGSNVTLPR